jgi:hypothetical protein
VLVWWVGGVVRIDSDYRGLLIFFPLESADNWQIIGNIAGFLN